MPDTAKLPSTPRSARQWPRVAVLTLGVFLGHWVLLRAAPMPTLASPAAPDRPWTTRIIAPAEPPPVTDSLRSRHSAPARSRAMVAAPQRTLDAAPDSPVETESAASAAIELAATHSSAAPEQVAASAQTDTPADIVAATDAVGVHRYAIPAPLRLSYDIQGQVKNFPYSANGELVWQHDGTTYDARLEISHFLLGSRVQTSKGQLTAQGLEPIRFGDKVRSEVAAHFERSKNKISYSANTPDEVLQPGAQDQLSVFMQLASMLGGDPGRFPPGSRIAFQAVGPRSSETWVFKAGTPELLALPAGKIKAIKFTKDPVGDYDSRAELWLAPELDYLPVRIRLTQSNGDFVDQLWRGTQKP